MIELNATFTVFFDEPFWVGVYERKEGGKLWVCKVVFGAEPKDNLVQEFIMSKWSDLRFSPPIATDYNSCKMYIIVV